MVSGAREGDFVILWGSYTQARPKNIHHAPLGVLLKSQPYPLIPNLPPQKREKQNTQWEEHIRKLAPLIPPPPGTKRKEKRKNGLLLLLFVYTHAKGATKGSKIKCHTQRLLCHFWAFNPKGRCLLPS